VLKVVHQLVQKLVVVKIKMMQNHLILVVVNHVVQKKIRKKVSKMKKYIIISILFALSFSYYEVGESISISDQSLTKSTCFAGNGYDVNDDWKLSDWNGELNGGNYNVIFLEMSATW
jgi:hypothetical protein